jgi:glycosyltransferase involved in cell wall biosynthesis
MRIITNFERFPLNWKVCTGESGTATLASNFKEFIHLLPEATLVLINGDVKLVFQLCSHFLKPAGSRKPIVAVDLVLRRPEGIPSYIGTIGKRILLSRVDHFINYFKVSEGYSKYYGITPTRSSFVNFKPNIRYRYNPETHREGGYILCFGKSRRDYDTFFRAAARIPYPCAILQPNFGELLRHGSRFTFRIEDLPKNVTILADDGTEQSMIRAIEGAKVVALPIVKQSMLAGISVYLNAMYLRKCVIVTAGAGISDVLTDEALIVPVEDVDALAGAMRLSWEDELLRSFTAEKGYLHAASLGGEPELHQRILEATVSWAMLSNRLQPSLYPVADRSQKA